MRYLVLCLLLLGCGPVQEAKSNAWEPSPIYIQDEELKLPFTEALLRFEYATGSIKLELTDSSDAPVRARYGVDGECLDPDADACVLPRADFGKLMVFEKPNPRVGLVMHELIHVLAYDPPHLPLPNTGELNIFKSPAGTCLSEADLALVCFVRHCERMEPECE